MAQLNERAAEDLDPVQAAELAAVIDLEARWENMRADRPGGAVGHGTLDLQNRQRTYEAFRSRWVAYTARYKTLRVPELTPNGPERLGAWCRAVRAVLRRAEGGGCPVHAVEKAHRLAGRIAERLKKEPVGRGGPLGGVGDAIREMDAVVRWCDGLLPPTGAEGAAEVGN
ncbi:MAG: hypothetical protein JWO38_3436 [Gemmataceae bacterium]|nr:hypothetical protein [Gemmataceae bacterium]